MAYKKSQKPSGSNGLPVPAENRITEPRCTVCQSPHRNAIDRELALGTAHSKLAEAYSINRRNIGRHALKHLNLEEAAIRDLIQQEAAYHNSNIELGVEAVVRRKVYLETLLLKAQEALVDNTTTVEPKDAIAAIEKLEKFDERTASAAIDEMKSQLDAFLKAVKEIVPPAMWEEIYKRTLDLAGVGAIPAKAKELASGDD